MVGAGTWDPLIQGEPRAQASEWEGLLGGQGASPPSLSFHTCRQRKSCLPCGAVVSTNWAFAGNTLSMLRVCRLPPP